MILVDSNVWIFGEIEDAPEHPLAVKWISRLLLKGQIAVNVIIASEAFHKLSRFFGREQARARVQKIVEHPLITWLSFEKEVATKAMSLAVNKEIRINDALIGQQAIERKASVLTDNVKDFKKIKGLKVIGLK